MEEEERQNLDNIINQIYGIKLKSPDLLKGYKKRGCLKRGSLFYYILRFSKKSLRLKLVPTYDLRLIYSSPYVKF